MTSAGPRQVADSRPQPTMAGPRVACGMFALKNEAAMDS